MNKLKAISLIKTFWGKIVAFAIGVVAVLTLVDYLLKWKILSFLIKTTQIFSLNFEVPLYVFLIILIVSILLIVLISRGKFKKRVYFIEIKDKFYNGYEPNDYSRRTKWYFKNNKDFYYVPLLSHGYNSVDFADLCGPYCNRCNHILHLNGGNDLGNKFVCVNCVKNYKIPKELLGEYREKLISYFREEFRQGNVQEAE